MGASSTTATICHARGLRFLYIDGEYAWKHVGEVRYLRPDATFTDCTDMSDDEFERFVFANPPPSQFTSEKP